MSTDPILAGLRYSKLFEGLDPEKLELICRLGQTASLDPGQPVIEEGQPNPDLFVVLRGKLEIFLPRTPDRYTRVRIATIGPGDCIGEYSFIDKNPASASVVPRERTEV